MVVNVSSHRNKINPIPYTAKWIVVFCVLEANATYKYEVAAANSISALKQAVAAHNRQQNTRLPNSNQYTVTIHPPACLS